MLSNHYSIFALSAIHSLCSLLIFCICSYYGDNQCIGTCPEHSRCDKGVCVCNHDQGASVIMSKVAAFVINIILNIINIVVILIMMVNNDIEPF